MQLSSVVKRLHLEFNPDERLAKAAAQLVSRLKQLGRRGRKHLIVRKELVRRKSLIEDKQDLQPQGLRHIGTDRPHTRFDVELLGLGLFGLAVRARRPSKLPRK